MVEVEITSASYTNSPDEKRTQDLPGFGVMLRGAKDAYRDERGENDGRDDQNGGEGDSKISGYASGQCNGGGFEISILAVVNKLFLILSIYYGRRHALCIPTCRKALQEPPHLHYQLYKP